MLKHQHDINNNAAGYNFTVSYTVQKSETSKHLFSVSQSFLFWLLMHMSRFSKIKIVFVSLNYKSSPDKIKM